MSNQTRERPMSFNSEMVNAISDRRKSQTRRPLKYDLPPEAEFQHIIDKWARFEAENAMWHVKMPYQVGDIIYVRETWYKFASCKGCMCDEEPEDQSGCYFYKAEHELYEGERWRPSIHMPRSAARLFLRVKRVWIERVQDITDADAKKEGVTCREEDHDCELAKVFSTASIAAFSRLWDSTVKKSELNRYGWAANPWVWVIEFEREEQS